MKCLVRLTYHGCAEDSFSWVEVRRFVAPCILNAVDHVLGFHDGPPVATSVHACRFHNLFDVWVDHSPSHFIDECRLHALNARCCSDIPNG